MFRATGKTRWDWSQRLWLERRKKDSGAEARKQVCLGQNFDKCAGLTWCFDPGEFENEWRTVSGSKEVSLWTSTYASGSVAINGKSLSINRQDKRRKLYKAPPIKAFMSATANVSKPP
jgi:hypothetical protein